MSNKKFINSYASGIIATLVALATIMSMTFVAAPALKAQVPIMDGDLIKVSESPDIWIVKLVAGKQFRRLILNPTIFDSYGHLRWDNVKTVSPSTLNSYKVSSLVREIYPDGRLVDGRVFRLYPQGDTGVKRYVNLTQQQFEMVEDKDSIYAINHLEASPTFYAMGSDLTAADFPQLNQQPTNPGTGTGTGAGAGQQPTVPGTGTGNPTPTTPTTTPGTTTPTTPTDPATTERLEGTIRGSLRTAPNNVKLYPGEEETVVTMRLQADSSSMTIQKVDVWFKGSGFNRAPERTFESITLANGDTEYATKTDLDSSDFSKPSGETRHRVRFEGLNITVPRNGEMDLDVNVMVRDDIVNTAYFQTWTVDFGDDVIRSNDTLPSLRYTDIDGSKTFMIDQATPNLTLSLNSSENPRQSIVVEKVYDDRNSNKDLLFFDIENEGQANAMINELKVKLQFRDSSSADGAVDEGTDATATYNEDLSKVVESLQLMRGSTELGTAEVPDETSDQNGVRSTSDSWVVVTFDFEDDPVVVRADSTTTFTVRANIAPISDAEAVDDALTYREGTRVRAITNDDETKFGEGTADVVFGDDEEEVTRIEGGMVTGKYFELHKVAPRVTLVGSQPSPTGDEGKSVTFMLRIQAEGGTIYVKKEDTECGASTAANALFKVTLNSATDVGTLICDNPQFANSPETVQISSEDWVMIPDGTTQDVNLNVRVNQGTAAGYFDVSLDEARWRTTSVATGSTQKLTLPSIESARDYIATSS